MNVLVVWTKSIVSGAKKRVEKFPVIAKENSEQIRQYQEIVSELIGVYKEHKFIHELNSQIPETIAGFHCHAIKKSSKINSKPFNDRH